jgi:AmiR/NasT family two-component response regulator
VTNEEIRTWAAAAGAIAAILGGFYAVVTRPVLALIRSESGRLEAVLRQEMSQMELRLNDRIDTRLARR